MIDADRTSDKPRTLSTGQVLSLLTSAVVVSVLTAAIIVTWLTLTRSALSAEQDRLARGARQLGTVAATGIRATEPRYRAIARDDAVRRLLREGGAKPDTALVAAAATALKRLSAPADSGLPLELWDMTGRRVAYVGDDLQDSIALGMRLEGETLAPSVRPGLDSVVWHDSLQIGALYPVGNRSYFWIAMPVIADGHRLGMILQQRRIASSTQAQRTIRELSGDSVTGYYRNVDGTGWTTLGGRPTATPIVPARDSAQTGSADQIYAEQRIAGTPLVIGLEVPRATVVGAAHAKVRQLGVFAIILTCIAGVLAWIVGQRVAQPLSRIAIAAGEVANGQYATRVPLTGTFEIASLADNFNNMARQIGESRAELEEREGELRMMADAIPQLAWMANARGEILWLNERWYAYTGAVRTGDHALQWSAAQDPAALGVTEAKWRAGITSGQPFEFEGRLRSSTGELRWFLTRVAPVHDRDGAITRWFGTSTDVQSLRDAREAAEAASRAKSEFLAAMSHELRTPLNAIGGYTELMELGIRGAVSAEQRQDLARIRASQQHLLTLIGSVLDLSRIESGRVSYNLEHVSSASLFASLEPLVAPQATAKHQSLRFESEPEGLCLVADRDKLRQILLNLLSNAIRHTPAGTTISVEARAKAPATIEITVCDTGPGIPADRRQSVFEPFVQLDRSLSKPTEGIGLGLAISRDLARGMHGDLTLVDHDGPGACFVVTLPAATHAERV